MKTKLKLRYNAPVVLTFTILCLIVVVLHAISAGLTTSVLFSAYRSSLRNPLFYIRLFTHVLGHDGWEHFTGNIIYLLLLGPMLEEKYGSKMLLKTIALTAICTSLIHVLLFSNTALCGASGVVFAFILLASFTEFKHGDIPLTFVLVSAIFIGKEILNGLFVQDNISNLSHITGGIIGAVLGICANKK